MPRKIDNPTAQAIRDDYATGSTQCALAGKYSLHQSTIQRILSGAIHRWGAEAQTTSSNPVDNIDNISSATATTSVAEAETAHHPV